MKGEPLGALHGVPVSLKDVLYTRGVRTTGGSRLFAELVPEEDNVAVGRLKAAGAVILGKTNTSEFGHKALTDNPLFGVTRNPWDLDAHAGRLERRRRGRGGERRWARSRSAPTAAARCASRPRFCGAGRLQAVVRPRAADTRVPGLGARRATRPDHAHRARRRRRARRRSPAATTATARSLPREAGSYLEACDGDVQGPARGVDARPRLRGGRSSACSRSARTPRRSSRSARLPRGGRESRLGESRGDVRARSWPRSSTRRGPIALPDARGRHGPLARALHPPRRRRHRARLPARRGARAARTGRRSRPSSSASTCC